jgi:hypothetical protein
MDIMQYVPKAAVTAFAAIGLFYVSKVVLSYVYLLLELFVLSGTSVSPPRAVFTAFTKHTAVA